MVQVPAETPVTTPVDPIVAIEVLLLLQVPPEVLSNAVASKPTQTDVAPYIEGSPNEVKEMISARKVRLIIFFIFFRFSLLNADFHYQHYFWPFVLALYYLTRLFAKTLVKLRIFFYINGWPFVLTLNTKEAKSPLL